MGRKLDRVYSEYMAEFAKLQECNTELCGTQAMLSADADLAQLISSEFMAQAIRVKYAQKYLVKAIREEMQKRGSK